MEQGLEAVIAKTGFNGYAYLSQVRGSQVVIALKGNEPPTALLSPELNGHLLQTFR